MDREVEPCEAAELERHVAECAECRSCAAEFRRVSGAFEEYCEEVGRQWEGRQATRMQLLLWAAAAAILLAVILGYSRPQLVTREERLASPAAVGMDSATAVTERAKAKTAEAAMSGHHTLRRAGAVHAERGAASPRLCAEQGCASGSAEIAREDGLAREPAIEIAIPVEAMFPPGAVPDGLNFVADMSIGADAGAEQLRLRPRTERFERRQEEK